jgi:hypothetical protein
MFINSFYFNELVSKFNIQASKTSFLYTYKLIDSQILEWISTSNITKVIKKISSNSIRLSPINLSVVSRSLILLIIFVIILYC